MVNPLIGLMQVFTLLSPFAAGLFFGGKSRNWEKKAEVIFIGALIGIILSALGAIGVLLSGCCDQTKVVNILIFGAFSSIIGTFIGRRKKKVQSSVTDIASISSTEAKSEKHSTEEEKSSGIVTLSVPPTTKEESTIRGKVSLILGAVNLFLPIFNYITGSIGIYFGVKQIRLRSTRSAKIGLTLNIMAMVLWTGLFVYFNMSDSAPSPLDASREFTGTFPNPGNVTFVTTTGEEITFESAYPGFVYMYTTRNTYSHELEPVVNEHGGEIVAALPRAGVYLIQVKPGNEAAFLSEMFEEPGVLNGFPAQQIIPATVTVYDFFSFSTNDNLDCKKDHGDLAKLQAGRLASSTEGVDLLTQIPHKGNKVEHIDIARAMLKRMKLANEKGERIVFSLSLQSGESGKYASRTRTGCTSIACSAVRLAQEAFFYHYLQTLDAQIAADPTIANNALFVIAAGNVGVDLDEELKRLKKQFPRAWRHIKIVGGTKGPGEIETSDNHLKDNSEPNMVYSLSKGVTVFGKFTAAAICDGTSFAAPEVAGILDYIWSHAPHLNATQVIEAFDKALAEHGKNNTLPQGAAGLTKEAFLTRAVEFAKGSNVQPKTLPPDTPSPGIELPTPTPSTAPPTPPLTLPPAKIEVQIALTSRTCTLRERYEDGSASYWVDVSGTASGPVDTSLHAYTSAGVATCGEWSAVNDWICRRETSDPATVQWTFRFPSYSAGSIGRINAVLNGETHQSVTFDNHC